MRAYINNLLRNVGFHVVKPHLPNIDVPDIGTAPACKAATLRSAIAKIVGQRFSRVLAV